MKSNRYKGTTCQHKLNRRNKLNKLDKRNKRNRLNKLINLNIRKKRKTT